MLQIDDQSDENDDELRVDEAKLLEDYKHTYWSRLVTVGADELEQERKWPLGPDIVEECQAVANMEEVDP